MTASNTNGNNMRLLPDNGPKMEETDKATVFIVMWNTGV